MLHLATVKSCTVPDNANKPLILKSSVTSPGYHTSRLICVHSREQGTYHRHNRTLLHALWRVTAVLKKHMSKVGDVTITLLIISAFLYTLSCHPFCTSFRDQTDAVFLWRYRRKHGGHSR